MYKITFANTKLEDVLELSTKLRKEDISELKALGYEPLDGLLKSFICSSLCKNILIDGELAAIYGVSKLQNMRGWGQIWMLGSDKLFTIPMSMIKESKRIIENILREYDIVFNMVDSRNTSHVKWLKMLGFTFGASTMVGGVEFIQFFKVSKRGK